MSFIIFHNDDCQKILGESMEKVHLFLDQYAKTFDVRVFGEYHRTFLHNQYGVSIALSRWGEVGRKAALIHIVRDYLDIPIYNWNFIEKYIGKAMIHFNNPVNFNLNLDPSIVKSWWPKGLCTISFQ